MIRAQGSLFIEVLPTPKQEHADGGLIPASPRDRAASQCQGQVGKSEFTPRSGETRPSAKPKAPDSSLEIRQGKKADIYRFFLSNVGRRFSSFECHAEFGSAFRTRVSEINRDPDLFLTIHNETKVLEGKEASIYWAELRAGGSGCANTTSFGLRERRNQN